MRQNLDVHHRRARPTLRVLTEDLFADWDSPHPHRNLAQGRLDALHPLSELGHPIITKARESFGADPSLDNSVGPIASSTEIRLFEIKAGQWRGGVWIDDESGVCWLVVAGLAKGNHQDRDDFYQQVKRRNDEGTMRKWLPQKEDVRLLKRETAARLLTEWELEVQQSVLDGLRMIGHGGKVSFHARHPIAARGNLAEVGLEVAPERDDEISVDAIIVEVSPVQKDVERNIIWQLTSRVLISLDPPEQGWDAYGTTYSNMGEPGHWSARVTELESLVADGTLAESRPGQSSHYAHEEHLAGSTIEGRAVRALCGVFFVPIQDHKSRPCCPECQTRYAELPS